MTKPAVAIFSGGLDSTTLVYEMIAQGYTPHLISFNYGQRHKKELVYAGTTARQLGLRHDIIDLSGITHLISNSALTSDHKLAEGNDIIDVPEGHYAEDTMKATVVPNRNMIMLSIAAGIAVNEGAEKIGIGVHGGDHFVYPDCRPEFIYVMNEAINVANAGFGVIPVPDDRAAFYSVMYAPYLDLSKADIAFRALELGVPLHMTWSCYKGGENHCGRCGTCVERLEAIDEAITRVNKLNIREYAKISMASGVPIGKFWDSTVYEDIEFWQTAVKK